LSPIDPFKLQPSAYWRQVIAEGNEDAVATDKRTGLPAFCLEVRLKQPLLRLAAPMLVITTVVDFWINHVLGLVWPVATTIPVEIRGAVHRLERP
jgi:hypothetical protein